MKTVEFTWDGNDKAGRKVGPPQQVDIEIKNVYEACYAAVLSEIRSLTPGKGWVFGGYCQVEGTSCIRGDAGGVSGGAAQCIETEKSTRKKASVGHFDTKHLGMGGWSLEDHHFYHPTSRQIYLGNGESYRASIYETIINRESVDFHRISNETAVSPENKIFIFSLRMRI